MSAFTPTTGIRTVVRQLAVAATLCAAVAAPAAFAADSSSVASATVSSAEDNVWPAPSPKPVPPLN
ncbi:hypothetical protein [Streptomyces sp. H27-C3]|uniref:hypothetical protein n=1 Tax=Streptomyces sp. H27-C3 TaxID=3046305 RepID=UPI0024B8AFC5|nr:hypothetical protein [Streptomyces sp. H27-C3]MDJ0464887.1 hypothetical protein [Streptomyces sp. H27-C3]